MKNLPLTPRVAKVEDDMQRLSKKEISSLPEAFEYYYFDYKDKNDNELFVFYNLENKSTSNNPYLRVEVKRRDLKPTILLVPFEKYYSQGDKFNYKTIFYNDEFKENNFFSIHSKDGEKIDYYTLNLDFGKNFKVNLKYEPLVRGFLPTQNGRFLFKNDDESNFAASTCAAPRNNISGIMSILENNHIKNLKLNGEGYHDHPYQSEQYKGIQFNWDWARFYTNEDTFVFIELRPNEGYKGGLKFLAHSKKYDSEMNVITDLEFEKSNYKKDKLFGAKYPTHYFIKTKDFEIVSNHKKTLLDKGIYHRSEVDLTINGKVQETTNAYFENFNVSDNSKSFMNWLLKKMYKTEKKKSDSFLKK